MAIYNCNLSEDPQSDGWMKIKGNVTENNNCNVDGKYQNRQKTLHNFAINFTISEILASRIFYHEKCRSMSPRTTFAMIWRISTSIKVIDRIFMLARTIFKMLMFQMFDLKNLGQGHRIHTTSVVMLFVENINPYKSRSTYFYASSHRFTDINV